jgi:hypothetical protein
MTKYKFELHMKEGDSSKEKALLEGIRAHLADATMNIYETRILVVETDNSKVAELLTLLNTTNLQQPKKRKSRKVAEPMEVSE